MEDVAAGMACGPRASVILPLRRSQPTWVSSWVSCLREPWLAAGQIIKAAVADVAKVHPAGRKPAKTQGGFHADAFVVAVAEVGERAVDLVEKFGQDVVEAGVQSDGGLAVGARQQGRDFINGDAAGVFAGLGAAHAIADGEDEVRRVGGRFAEFAEVDAFAGVESQAEEGVLVVGADAAADRCGRTIEA